MPLVSRIMFKENQQTRQMERFSLWKGATCRVPFGKNSIDFKNNKHVSSFSDVMLTCVCVSHGIFSMPLTATQLSSWISELIKCSSLVYVWLGMCAAVYISRGWRRCRCFSPVRMHALLRALNFQRYLKAKACSRLTSRYLPVGLTSIDLNKQTITWRHRLIWVSLSSPSP